jgi:hypothetical protein
MAAVAAGGGYVTVGWYDSRHDACFSQERPIGNCADGHAPAGGSLDVYVKRLNESTGAWDPAATRVTTVTQNPNLETAASLSAFVGDYISASYGAGSTRIAWTDNRDIPVQPTTDDGNDVLGDPFTGGPCTTTLTDPCWNQTLGKYKNIWIASIN